MCTISRAGSARNTAIFSALCLLHALALAGSSLATFWGPSVPYDPISTISPAHRLDWPNATEFRGEIHEEANRSHRHFRGRNGGRWLLEFREQRLVCRSDRSDLRQRQS